MKKNLTTYEKTKIWRLKNPKKHAAQARRYSARHPDRRKITNKKSHLKHKPERLKKMREYNEANKEDLKQYYIRNRAKILKRRKERYQEQRAAEVAEGLKRTKKSEEMTDLISS